MIEIDKLRINKLRLYLFDILKEIIGEGHYQINADMLSADANNYSLDKIPLASKVETWINGTKTYRDVYSFRSRCMYSQDAINNLKNIGFFEIFENVIETNNRKKVLPDIQGIDSIECLNCGSMNDADTNTAEFEIQIQIKYIKELRRDY